MFGIGDFRKSLKHRRAYKQYLKRSKSLSKHKTTAAVTGGVTGAIGGKVLADHLMRRSENKTGIKYTKTQRNLRRALGAGLAAAATGITAHSAAGKLSDHYREKATIEKNLMKKHLMKGAAKASIHTAAGLAATSILFPGAISAGAASIAGGAGSALGSLSGTAGGAAAKAWAAAHGVTALKGAGVAAAILAANKATKHI